MTPPGSEARVWAEIRETEGDLIIVINSPGELTRVRNVLPTNCPEVVELGSGYWIEADPGWVTHVV